jgi:hypothetical protein
MEQLSPGLLTLLITIVGALTALVERVRRDLGKNTTLTKEAKASADLLLAQLAAERNTVVGLRAVVRERDDRIAYLVARLPEAEALMRNYGDRRTTRATEADILAAEHRLTQDDSHL